MFLEALEILNSAGQDEDTFVTDFGIYKITYILTVYLPIALSTFLLSQEYLGDKIACFAPDSFSENHADAVNEYCWNNGFWVSDGVLLVKNLYTQPHRFYPLYLPVQAILFTTPIVLWNILTKSHLLAVLKGTEEFLQDLLDVVQKGDGDDEGHVNTATRAKELMRQFHQTCVQAAQKSGLAKTGILRVSWEMFLLMFTICMQFFIYNHKIKEYQCTVPEIDSAGNEILCTVPILDLLDAIWSFNLSALLTALLLNFYMVYRLYQMHFSEFQPLFYNSLPYGDTDDFNEKVTWDSRWTKDSYRLLTRIFLENNSIMTKAYVLMALKPQETEEKVLSDREREQQHRLRRLSQLIDAKQATEDSDEEDTDGEHGLDIKWTNRRQSIKSTNQRRGSKPTSPEDSNSANGNASSDHRRSSLANGNAPLDRRSSLANGNAPSERRSSHVTFSDHVPNGNADSASYDAESRINGSANVFTSQSSMSSGRGSMNDSPNDSFNQSSSNAEAYSAFRPLASSSSHNVFRETEPSEREVVRFENVVNDAVSAAGIRQRSLKVLKSVNIQPNTTAEEVKPKLRDFSVIT